MRGRFIALEGLDGAGTTTATRLVTQGLEQRGISTLATFQPSDRSIGVAIRGHLRDGGPRLDPHALALLFAADRLDHVHATIEPALTAGRWVVCDRYVLSSWAYQGSECDAAWVRVINERAPWPDLTCVLVIEPSEAGVRIAQRAKQRDTPAEIFDALAVQRRVAARYDEALREGLAGVVAIDATRPPDEVAAAILDRCASAGLF